MSEAKDKLFGKTIPLTANEDADTVPIFHEDNMDQDLPSTTTSDNKKLHKVEQDQPEKDTLGASETKEDGASPPSSDQLTNPAASSGTSENPKTPSAYKETAIPNASKTEEELGEISNSQEKTLKKPDKILPCPRCNSMDTKFCYYNNYNVNQPRHFCKNCQRYWTAGGTMRNVPVGAGCRKSKNSALHYRHVTVSDVLQIMTESDAPDWIHHPLKPNGTVVTFDSDTPLCESMAASVLNLAEKMMRNCTRNGFHRPEEHTVSVSCRGGENGDDYFSGTSVTASNST
ncbi:hypothetical protein NE237_005665 [Protea cynaroides]|uniref:Dof-type domain-containing protein n=1 Tax=Protea cynaroides TaxID=273540 RepID=A0A9Q0KL39_9MAGN|nr:hypothetical protein NE237_005665 [Protea cynaroides]